MADGSSGGGAGMGMVVGALVVIVAVVGVIMFAGGNLGGTKHVDVNVHAPAAAPVRQ